MHRRFVAWLLAASSTTLVLGLSGLLVGQLERSSERALERSLLVSGSADPSLFAAELETSDLPLALRRALDEGRPDKLLEILRVRGVPYEDYPVLSAAALFEMGREGASRELWDGRAPTSAFERRLLAARRLREEGVDILLRDERGRLLGGLDAAGELRLASSVPAGVVPREVAEPVLSSLPPTTRRLPRLRGSRPASGRLSLDLKLSRLAAAALEGYRGSIVLVDIASGAVRAAVSDLETVAEGGTPAFEQRREPASIAKLITISAALRAGIDPDAAIAGMQCRGAIRLGGEILYCSAVNGRLRGVDHALAVSCNVAFAELGRQIGEAALRREYALYGFSDADGAQEPYRGRLLNADLSERQLGDLAIGLNEADITPLHAALVAASMASGRLPAPRLLGAIESPLGLVPQQPPAGAGFTSWRTSGVLERPWTRLLVGAMGAVVSPGGTAAFVDDPHFPVAMKTGTGRDPGRYFHVNYIGIGPMPDPHLAFAVRITGERTSRRVRRAGYRVTERLLAALGDLAARDGIEAAPMGVRRTAVARVTDRPRPTLSAGGGR